MDFWVIERQDDPLPDIPYIEELIVKDVVDINEFLKRCTTYGVRNVYIVGRKTYISFENRTIYYNDAIYSIGYLLSACPFQIQTLHVYRPCSIEEDCTSLDHLEHLVYYGSMAIKRILEKACNTLRSITLVNTELWRTIPEGVMYPNLAYLDIKRCKKQMIELFENKCPNLRYIETPEPLCCNTVRGNKVIPAYHSSWFKQIRTRQHASKVAVTFILSARATLGRDLCRLIGHMIYHSTTGFNDNIFALQEGDTVYPADNDAKFVAIWKKSNRYRLTKLNLEKKKRQNEQERKHLEQNKAEIQRLQSLVNKREQSIVKRTREINDVEHVYKKDTKALEKMIQLKKPKH